MARILVIDDDEQMRAAVGWMLKRAGYEVVEAAGGGEGVKCYCEGSVDLVITDIFMPEKDGLAVIEEVLREDPMARIISMTAGEGDDCALAKELGATRTFVKPFRLEELLEAVAEVLGE